MLFFCGHFFWIFLALVLTFTGRLSFLGAKTDFWKWRSFFDYILTDNFITVNMVYPVGVLFGLIGVL